MVYGKRLLRGQHICPECGVHQRQTAEERIEQLFDESTIEYLQLPVRSSDPLEFADTVPYPERLEAARRRSGLEEGVLVATGTVGGRALVAAVMDFRFMGGSLGAAIGEVITRAAEHAFAEHTPLLIVSASGGARMQEGALALMQMAKTAQALASLDEAGVLTISLVTDPTYGGVAASFSTLCDVIVAEPGARLGFAGPRVIQQTLRQSLPEGFQTAEFLLEHGFIDAIRTRRTFRTFIGHLLALQDRDAKPDPARPDPVIREPTEVPVGDPWETVQGAREVGRPTTLDYLTRAFDDFEELHGDRLGGDCPAVVGGPALLDGVPVMVIGHQKGRTAAEMSARNYGMPTPDGYRKAGRLMQLAAKLRVPVVTLVDTPGAFPGVEAERHGQAVAIAENIRLMTTLPVPVVTMVIGEGGSGGALALAVADDVLIGSGAIYSVISPEGCAAILWSDATKAPTAAAALHLDGRRLLDLGVVDGVVPEPERMTEDHAEAARRVRGALAASLRRLATAEPGVLVASRRARFRAFGTAEAAVGRADVKAGTAEGN
ncbi:MULTISPECIES: carboxyl transferase domain-containing protein [unclassified Pseudonocardia]|uniref:carboxyl transferase domain-containing protein n=1 Tax=unclassified Pseudonocardia TaxID=2619320 RepID=UPI0007619BA4